MLPLKKADLKEKSPIKVDIEGRHILIVMIDGSVHAIDSVCSHRGGPLEKGVLVGHDIKCPWHGALYDVTTGKVDPSTPWGKVQTPYKIGVAASGELSVDF